MPLAHSLTGVERHDSTQFEVVCRKVAVKSAKPGRRRTRPASFVADKAYSCRRIRRYLASRNIGAYIPKRSTESRRGRPSRNCPETYKRRHIIECCLGWLKENRRVGTRYEKLAVNFSTMVDFAIMDRYFRTLAA